MNLEAHFDGERVRVFLNGHRLRIAWAVVAVLIPFVIAWDWRREH